MVEHMRLWSVRGSSLLLVLAVLAGLLPLAAAPALAGSGGFVAVPFSTSVPTVDGTCAENEYSDAAQVRGSSFANPPGLKITADNLFVCMAASSSSFRLLVDTNNDSKLDAGDFQVAANLFIIGVAQSNDIRINRYNPTTGEFDGPAPGVVEVAMRFIGTTNTTTEIRIARQTLGDWPRTIGLAMLAVEAGSWPPQFSASAPGTWGSATLVSVPPEILRRALNFLEESRAAVGTWATAALDPVPQLFFRPDVDGIAYYEFAVRLPGANAGFILLSSGKHDRPIAHWLAEGDTLSQQLFRQSDGQAVKYFKLDSLYYVAENNSGQLVAELGQQPPKVTAPTTPVDGTGDATPPASQLQQANPNDWNVSYTGIFTTPAGLTFSGWGTWSEMKGGYTSTYQPFLTALRQNAAGEWAVEENINQNGIALLKGETYILRYSAGGTTALSGPGTALIQTSTPNPNALQITVVNDQPGDPVPFAVRINYGSGGSETVNFAVVASIGRSLVYLPLVTRGGAGTTAQVAETASQTQGETQTQAADPNLPPAAPAASTDDVRLQNGDWRFWYADGGDADQRLYRQLRANTPPNNNGCASGCGPTAWAML
ncbi:MAG: hypothetical protein MUD01_22175, partial [Chloroflexaceae bacterium]|nr:hypothetical protein [Chloroflexaceae bacterium]